MQFRTQIENGSTKCLLRVAKLYTARISATCMYVLPMAKIVCFPCDVCMYTFRERARKTKPKMTRSRMRESLRDRTRKRHAAVESTRAYGRANFLYYDTAQSYNSQPRERERQRENMTGINYRYYKPLEARVTLEIGRRHRESSENILFSRIISFARLYFFLRTERIPQQTWLCLRFFSTTRIFSRHDSSTTEQKKHDL